MNDAIDSSNILFALSEEEKMRVKMDETGIQSFARGYIQMGQEAGLRDKYYEPKEGYSFGSQTNNDHDEPPINMLQCKNIWPEGFPIENRAVLDGVLIDHTAVVKGIVNAIQLVENNRSNHHHANSTTTIDYMDITEKGEDISIMRLFHYHPIPSSSLSSSETEFEMICSSPHSDWGFLTTILQDNVGGLQINYRNKWIDVPVVENGLIINAGDYLSIVSRNRYVAPIHRVVCPKSAIRNSFVYFFYPKYDSALPDISSSAVNVTDYNTLLSSSIAKNEKFGDYVIKKWKGVLKLK